MRASADDPPMDEGRVGRSFRVLRRARGWRQVDVAAAAGVSQGLITAIERGRWTTLSVATLRRIFATVGADFDCVVRFRGAELDRLLDERHAATSGVVASLLRQRGWKVAAEVCFNHYGDRGSIDLLAYQASPRTALVVEVKTEIASAEETMRRLDVKARLGAALALARFGERPLRVVRLLAVVDSTANRRRVARLDPLFGPSFPLRGVPLRRWLETPGPVAAASGPAAGGLLFVSDVPNIGPGTGKGGSRRIRRAGVVPAVPSLGDSRTGSSARSTSDPPGGCFAAPGLIFRDGPARQER